MLHLSWCCISPSILSFPVLHLSRIYSNFHSLLFKVTSNLVSFAALAATKCNEALSVDQLCKCGVTIHSSYVRGWSPEKISLNTNLITRSTNRIFRTQFVQLTHSDSTKEDSANFVNHGGVLFVCLSPVQMLALLLNASYETTQHINELPIRYLWSEAMEWKWYFASCFKNRNYNTCSFLTTFFLIRMKRRCVSLKTP
jgi:hypothetical protein